MNGGDTDTGGAKVNPNNTPSLTPQPDTSTASDVEAESILTISHDDHPTSVGPQPAPQPTTAEPTVSPTPPVQSAPSTTVSTPTTQPASSTMPVPPITDLPQSAPQAPQPVGQPVAPVVTPANPFTSPTATTLPPQTLTPSQFPQQQPVQFPAQSMPASSGDIVLGSSAPKKSRKGLIIVLICLAILAIGAIIALVVFQSSRNGNSGNQSSQNNTEQFTTKEEVYDTLYDFNSQHYANLIKIYDLNIGLTPNFAMSSNDFFFPAESYPIQLSQGVEDTTIAYSDISSKLPDMLSDGGIELLPTKNLISESLEGINQNINLIDNFYNVYISPLSDESRPSTCAKTQDMIALEQNYPEAASKYYALYCDATEYLGNIYNGTGNVDLLNMLRQEITAEAADAASALNAYLVNIIPATNAIDQLITELRQ